MSSDSEAQVAAMKAAAAAKGRALKAAKAAFDELSAARLRLNDLNWQLIEAMYPKLGTQDNDAVSRLLQERDAVWGQIPALQDRYELAKAELAALHQQPPGRA